ncbi:MAG: B12-binding domain-containing radical SAM protein [Deltaproteobacteria bacterium]|nr:B12-binding domain-containing radical SAM protein [Deltaproteobacteria bacterium]
MNATAPHVFMYQRMHVQRIAMTTLSTVLKDAGMTTELVSGEPALLTKRLREHSGRAYVLYTAMTPEYGPVRDIAANMRAQFGDRIRQCVGGYHAMFFPEQIDTKVFDGACIGEGERAVADWVRREENDADHAIPNIYDGAHPYDTIDLAPLLTASEIPQPDTQILKDTGAYDKRHFFIASGRRCPYHCTFCHNHRSMRLFKGMGEFYVQRSIDDILVETRRAVAELGIKRFAFYSDLLALHRDWFLEFLAAYERDLRTPFKCFVRADQIDPEVARGLINAGCESVEMGLETGSEERRKALKKKITNEDLFHAMKCLHNVGIHVQTTNMLGLPGESYPEALETIRFNREIGADQAWFILFVPFPKTDLGDDAIEMGMVGNNLWPEVLDINPHDRSLLTTPEARRIEILHKFAYILFFYPWMESFVERLSHGPFRAVYRLIYRASYFWLFYRRSRRLSFREGVRTVYRAIADRL